MQKVLDGSRISSLREKKIILTTHFEDQNTTEGGGIQTVQDGGKGWQSKNSLRTTAVNILPGRWDILWQMVISGHLKFLFDKHCMTFIQHHVKFEHDIFGECPKVFTCVLLQNLSFLAVHKFKHADGTFELDLCRLVRHLHQNLPKTFLWNITAFEGAAHRAESDQRFHTMQQTGTRLFVNNH